MVTFLTLKNNYPLESQEILFASLGGEWPGKTLDINYRNTCAIRMSVAMNRSGLAIPNKYKEAIAGNGDPIVLKVATMGHLVNEFFGEFDWAINKQPGQPFSLKHIPKKTGIIAYHAQWKDATGHFDLWDKMSFIGAGTEASISDGFAISFWAID